MIDLCSFEMPIFKKMAESLTINNYRKKPLPDHLAEVNGVKDKNSIIWRRSLLF